MPIRDPMDRAAAQLAPILIARFVRIEQQLTTLRHEFQLMSHVSESMSDDYCQWRTSVIWIMMHLCRCIFALLA
jgi:hypothetical protein